MCFSRFLRHSECLGTLSYFKTHLYVKNEKVYFIFHYRVTNFLQIQKYKIMKIFFKLFALATLFIFSSNQNLQAQQFANANQVMQYYKDYKNSGNGKVVGINFVTNLVSKTELSVNSPAASWGEGVLNSTQNGMRSNRMRRHVSISSQKNGNQPFAANKTHFAEIIVNFNSNQFTAFMVKGNRILPIQINAVVSRATGHILYGTFGNRGGIIAISVFKLNLPPG